MVAALNVQVAQYLAAQVVVVHVEQAVQTLLFLVQIVLGDVMVVRVARDALVIVRHR